MAGAEQNWLPAARLLRPQGRHGELLAEPHTDAAVFTAGRRFWLAAHENSMPEASAERELEHAWQPTGRNAGRTVMKLRGVDSISEAEAIAGQFLLLRTAELPPLEADSFRVRDLVGCTLFDGDRLAGTVVDVQFPVASDGRTRLQDAPDLLAVETVTDGAEPNPEQDPVLIPFVRAWLLEVDLVAKRILMQLPEGLVDSSTAVTLDESEPDVPAS